MIAAAAKPAAAAAKPAAAAAKPAAVVTASIDAWAMPSWASAVHEHPAAGPPGLSVGDRCVLYRGRSGRLLGVLLVYVCRGRPGFMIHVSPKARRRRIGTKMLAKALELWPDLDLIGERYTSAGAGFVNAFLCRNRDYE